MHEHAERLKKAEFHAASIERRTRDQERANLSFPKLTSRLDNERGTEFGYDAAFPDPKQRYCVIPLPDIGLRGFTSIDGRAVMVEFQAVEYRLEQFGVGGDTGVLRWFCWEPRTELVRKQTKTAMSLAHRHLHRALAEYEAERWHSSPLDPRVIVCVKMALDELAVLNGRRPMPITERELLEREAAVSR